MAGTILSLLYLAVQPRSLLGQPPKKVNVAFYYPMFPLYHVEPVDFVPSMEGEIFWRLCRCCF